MLSLTQYQMRVHNKDEWIFIITRRNNREKFTIYMAMNITTFVFYA